MQLTAEPQATPTRTADDDGGAAKTCVVQLAPSQRSTNDATLVIPTAVQADGELQETLVRPAPAVLEVGVDSRLQFVPFQRSVIEPIVWELLPHGEPLSA